MTDINAGTVMPEIEKLGIPAEMIGNPRPASIEAKRTSFLAPSENAEYVGGDTIRFSLPMSQNHYLTPDVSFEFDWTNTSDADTKQGALDYSASAIIQRIRIFHGSNLLSDVSEYGRLRQIINDVSQSPVNSSTISNVLEGTPQTAQVLGKKGAGGTTAISSLSAVPRQQRSTFINRNDTRRYKVALVDGLIGTLATASLPCHAMTAAPLRVEIELATTNNCVLSVPARVANDGAAGVTAAMPITWKVSKAQLNATFVQVSSSAQALIDQACGGKYMLNTSMYRHSQQNINGDSNQVSILLPFSFSSLKHLVHGLYVQTNENDQTKYTISGRSKCHVEHQWYQIGASRVPSQYINGEAELLSEACKCFAVSSDLLQVCNHLDTDNISVELTEGWYLAGSTAVATADKVSTTNKRGTFAFGFDLECWGAKSSAQRIENGINSTSLQLYVNFETSSGNVFGKVNASDAAAAKQIECHSWAQYDCLITCMNGTAYARF
jgi:hypothetical protein